MLFSLLINKQDKFNCHFSVINCFVIYCLFIIYNNTLHNYSLSSLNHRAVITKLHDWSGEKSLTFSCSVLSDCFWVALNILCILLLLLLLLLYYYYLIKALAHSARSANQLWAQNISMRRYYLRKCQEVLPT